MLPLQEESQILRAVNVTDYSVVSARGGDHSLIEQALGYVAIRATQVGGVSFEQVTGRRYLLDAMFLEFVRSPVVKGNHWRRGLVDRGWRGVGGYGLAILQLK